jgi:hypothetical protein
MSTQVNLGVAAKEVLSFLATAGEFSATTLSFIQTTVVAAEHSLQSGTDKMTAVLNATEAFAAQNVPLLLNNIEAFMKAVSAFVSAMVTVYNDLGIFIHKTAPAAVGA